MSTRAVFTFIEGKDQYHVYKHSDGYPEGALAALTATLAYVWPLPRFEADEFAAGFIAANKREPDSCQPQYIIDAYRRGGIRLLKSGRWDKVSPCDIEYRYEIRLKNNKLHIVVDSVSERDGQWTQKLIWAGTLDAMAKRFGDKTNG